MPVISYAVQIDMTDLTTDTDTDRGLYAGFFRWVTGRPQFDGATATPTGEAEGAVWKEGILVSRKDISPMDRIIDVNQGGDYGSLSGFNFKIDNTSDYGAVVVGFDDYLLTNGYEIINRPVKAYAIVGTEFVQAWGGVVSETYNGELKYAFICSDIFEEVHKAIPSNEITLKNFPLADGDSVGRTIPITFGDVLRNELFNITGKSQPIILGHERTSGVALDLTAATAYNVYPLVDGRPYLDISTYDESFPQNFFQSGEYFLIGIKGTDESVRIIGNDETSSHLTRIFLAKKLSVTIPDYNNNHAYGVDLISSDVWYFKIIKFDTTYIASNGEIHSFVQNSLNAYKMTQWNKDTLDYDLVNDLVAGVTTDNSDVITPYPNVRLLNNEISVEGDINRNIPVYPSDLKLISYQLQGSEVPDTVTINGDQSVLLDKDRSTYLEIDVGAAAKLYAVDLWYEVEFPTDVVINGMSELFMVFDSKLEYTLTSGLQMRYFWELKAIDTVTGLEFEDKTLSSYPNKTPDTNRYYNFIPDDYYVGGNLDGRVSDFDEYNSNEFLSDLLKLSPNLVEGFNDATVSKKFRLNIFLRSVDVGIALERISNFRMYQIGFYANKTLNVKKEPIYIKTKGELVDSNQTNNVRRTFEHILETYDGIPSSDIDYGNLETGLTRDSWPTARQLKKKKLSSVYLKELAAQSFVALYPDRQGKRHFKSFLDDTTVVWTHAYNNGTIKKDSIKKFAATPINELYNEFTLNYDWNPGLKQFNRTIFIRNVNAVGEPDPLAASFPDEIDSTGVDTGRSYTSVQTDPLGDGSGLWLARIILADTSWSSIGQKCSFQNGEFRTEFFFGEITKIKSNTYIFVKFNDIQGASAGAVSTTGTLTSHSESVQKWTSWVGGINSYITAKEHWEACYNSWLKTKTVNKLPNNLGNCFWYHDAALFDGTGESTDNSAAHQYLAWLVSWTTRQKNRVPYVIPVNLANLQVDLMDVVNFKDQKYTNDDFQLGYFERVTINPPTDEIYVSAIMRPDDLETPPFGGDLIIESGSQPDLITESGSQPDIIQESGA